MVPSLPDIPVAADNLLPLLQRIQRRDSAALALLYEQCVDRLYALALRVVGIEADAEDVLSEVFLQVWRTPDSYTPERGSVMAWLVIIARSRAIDLLRKRLPAQRLDPVETLANRLEAPGPLPPEAIAQWQESSLLRLALEKLTPIQRQMIELAFFEGLTQTEIAQLTRLPLGTVKSHLRRAQIDLEQRLQIPSSESMS